jgi:hypothetical protein
LNIHTAANAFGAAGLLAIATMIRPTGIFLPLFAPLPLLLMKGSSWPRALLLAVLACAVTIAPMLVWTARNKRVAGLDTMSTDSAITIFGYNAPGVLAYATNRSFADARSELTREIGWQGDPTAIPSQLTHAMMVQSLKVFAEYPVATFVVTARGLILVATVPDRNELNQLIGTNGGGPLGLAPSYEISTRIERTLKSPALTFLVLAQLLVSLVVWAGVVQALIRAEWNSKIGMACILIPLAAAFAMLLCAAGPDAHARFRVPAVPFLAMLASIGWLGRRTRIVASRDAAVRDRRAYSRNVAAQMS